MILEYQDYNQERQFLHHLATRSSDFAGENNNLSTVKNMLSRHLSFQNVVGIRGFCQDEGTLTVLKFNIMLRFTTGVIDNAIL